METWQIGKEMGIPTASPGLQGQQTRLLGFPTVDLSRQLQVWI